MNIAPALLAQIQDPATLAVIREILSSLTTGYHREHDADDRHLTSMTIDGQSVGLWTDLGIGEAQFTGQGSMTLTAVTITALKYTLINRTMTVAFSFSGTVGGTPNLSLLFRIPKSRRSVVLQYNACIANDGGASVSAYAGVHAFTGSNQIAISKLNGTNWTAGTVIASGEITFEVTAA